MYAKKEHKAPVNRVIAKPGRKRAQPLLEIEDNRDYEVEQTNQTRRYSEKPYSHPTVYQRVGTSMIIGGAVIGGLLLRLYNQLRRKEMPISSTTVNPIPTERSAFGQNLRLGGLYASELTNEEITEQVGILIDANHRILYEKLMQNSNNDTRKLVELTQNVRKNPNSAPGDLCHDLTRYLIEKRTGKRPTIDQLREGCKIAYNLNGGERLQELLKGVPPGTSVFLGADNAEGGHSFTVIGELDDKVILADRQPANPIASLKYASAMENELRLARNLHPDQAGKIDREFSGKITLRLFEKEQPT